jgi:diguanylate cyclase (GGDEF)-like protein
MRVQDLLPPVLLRSEELGQAQRVRLVASLYEQTQSLVEGNVALAVLQTLCWLCSGIFLFAVLACATLGVLAARLRLAAAMAQRYDESSPEPDTPELWAGRFVAGATMTGLLWGATSVLALVRVDNPPLHVVVLITQAGWLAGAVVRNAASPAAVLGQSATTIAASLAGSLATGRPVYVFAAIFYVLMFRSIRSVAAYLGEQLELHLLSEQRLGELNARLNTTCGELERANAWLEHLSSTDGLTGIGNRRAFDRALLACWDRAARDRAGISLLLIDVDSFKSFNDRYGHPAGDECLRGIADVLSTNLRRSSDFAGRFGGEEFVVLLPAVILTDAMEIGERLREAVAMRGVPHEASKFGIVTISVGAACMVPGEPASPHDLITAADQALYRAKQAGRNRIETTILPPELPPEANACAAFGQVSARSICARPAASLLE